MTVDRIVIEGRFNGPPGSGNGGYACGLAAAAYGGTPAEVTLRRPPPLETAMELERSDESAEMRVGNSVVAAVAPWGGDLDVPAPPSPADLKAAESAFDIDAYADSHAFPTCFTCGPRRAEGEGLHLFPAPIGPGSRVGWRWTPDASLDTGHGSVDQAVMWAALDCPGGLAWIGDEAAGLEGPVVLGRLAASIDRAARIGEPCLVAGWQLDRDGRKLSSGTAVWTADGELLAKGRATWIVLDPEQAAAFTGQG